MSDPSPPPQSYSSRRINVILVIGALAMSLQLWSFRGALTYNVNCREVYELLQDAPLSTRERNGVTIQSVESAQELVHKNQHQSSFPLPRNNTSHSLAVIVLSRRNAFTVRQAIRQTWAKNHDNVYFVLGQGCPIPVLYRGVDEGGNSFCKVKPRPLDTAYMKSTMAHIQQEEKLTQQLIQEQEQYHDLLVMPAIDMYRTLPQKLKFAYTFVHHHLPPQVEWVLKVDDDFFVRLDLFEEELRKSYNATQQAILVGGDIRRDHKAHTGGKWKELPQFPHGGLYPPFPLGSYGHVVTRPIVEYVVRYQEALFDYQGEDVSLGIWLQHPLAPNTTFIDNRRMSNGGDCRKPGLYVVGHDITPPKMRVCHNKKGS